MLGQFHTSPSSPKTTGKMMFDPPDFPYKELADSLRDHYDPDDLLLSNTHGHSDPVTSNKSLADVAEQMISNVENQLSFTSNDSGKFFTIDNNLLDCSNVSDSNAELYVVHHSDNLFNYEPTLLDEHVVNQFLLPLQVLDTNKDTDNNNGPDLLALHSCAICHDIFTTDSDLLDHTILVHASDNIDQNQQQALESVDSNKGESPEENTTSFDFEAEWLVCYTCERVLSTALEVEPDEQLCCVDSNGKSSVSKRKLHTMYVCDYCSGLFADGEALDKHRLNCIIEDHHNFYGDSLGHSPANLNTSRSQNSDVYFSTQTSKPYKTAEDSNSRSIECQRTVVTRRNERRPFTSGGNSKMWNCGSCNQLFATARELYRHKRGEDRPAGAPLMAYVCEECDKVLGSMCALHTHKKMHKVTKPGYPCRVCGRRFNQSGHLAIHMRMHTGERPYPCDLCAKAFKVKVERDDHRRTHTGERPFACTACPKTFTAAARLREHARIHTDQRPYRCDICGAAFRRPYARTVHTLIHTGEKPHACDVCGTAFRRSGDMWKHKRTLHGIQATSNDA